MRVLYAAHSSFMQQTPETIFRIRMASCSLMMSVEVTTSSDDPSYSLLVWNVATILQHFLFCKWQGI